MTEDLFEAIRLGDAARVKDLLAQDPTLANARAATGASAVMAAVYTGAIDVLQALLDAGPLLDIFEAAAVGDANEVRHLLEGDPSLVNRYSHDGWTPLHLAGYVGKVETARALLEAGASVNALSTNGMRNTPLHAALAGYGTRVAPLLLEAGADVNAQDSSGYTPLHLVAQNGNLEGVRLLLARGADAARTNHTGKLPVAFAIEEGHTDIADILR